MKDKYAVCDGPKHKQLKFPIFVSNQSHDAMSQYIITTHNSEKSEALIQYLRTLDFIEVESVSPEDRRETALAFQEFLEALPERSSPQSSVNKAIKGYRKERGYQ